MRKIIVPALVLLALSSAPAFAQDAADQDTRRAAEAADREDRGEWGWLGLLGLAGLLGLKRRDADDRLGRPATGTR
jgi:hypothetical protein